MKRDEATKRRQRSTVLVVALLAAPLIFVAFLNLLPEAQVSDDQFHRFLAEMGADVRDDAALPDEGGVVILTEDLRTLAQADELIAWVGRGGRLIVTDPTSTTAERLGIHDGGSIGIVGTETLAPDCLASTMLGVDGVSVEASDAIVEAPRTPALRCLSIDEGNFYLEFPRGEGSVAALGGMSPFSPELLAAEENARFGWQLLAGRTDVVFAAPAIPGTVGPGLWASLPTVIKAMVIQLLVVLVVAAVVVGRRLGMAPDEAPLAPIPASELLGAVAGLYRAGHAIGHSATMIRSWTLQRLARRSGVPPDGDRDVVIEMIAAQVDQPLAELRGTLSGALPRDDASLAALARANEALARTIEGAR